MVIEREGEGLGNNILGYLDKVGIMGFQLVWHGKEAGWAWDSWKTAN